MEKLSQNIMTIDVEDWYNSSLDIFKDSDVEHGAKPDASVIGNTLKTLELLDQTQSKATFFVLGTVAEHYPDLVKEILGKGHEVASHGYSHQLVYNMSAQAFEDDLKISLNHLAKAGCSDIRGYRAPYWSITKKSLWALEILQKLGFEYDSSIFPIRRGLYGIADANPSVHQISENFWEFPPATIRMFGMNWPIAGGGYLRLVPYWIIASAIRRTDKDKMRIFYCHPYELDPTDVELKHDIKTARSLAYFIQQKLGRQSNPEKLERLMTEYDFTSIKNKLAQLRNEQGS